MVRLMGLHSREFMLQPPAILSAVLMALLLLGLAFGFHVTRDNGVIVSISIAGERLEGPASLLAARELLRTFAGLVVMALVFFAILQHASVYAEGLTHPLLGVTLACGVSRRGWLAARHAACLAVQVLPVWLAALGASVLVHWKIGMPVYDRLAGAALLLSVEMLTLLAVSSLLGAVLRHPTAVAVLVLAWQFALSPMISMYAARRGIGPWIQVVIPPVDRMLDGACSAAAGALPDIRTSVAPLPLLVLGLVLVSKHFRHEDLE